MTEYFTSVTRGEDCRECAQFTRMTDYLETFKKLSFGCVFDLKRFKNDADLFGLSKKTKSIYTGNTEIPLTCVNTDMSVETEIDKKKLHELSFEYGINAFGENVPSAIRSFENSAVKIPRFLVSTMENCLYTKPTPVQMQVIPLMINGRNTLASAPTGSGKTFAYLFPILSLADAKNRHISTLIILPTKELAQQIFNEVEILIAGSKLRSVLLTKNYKKIKSFNVYNIVVSTPQRMVELLSQSESKIDLSNLEWVILDEGDLLFSDGKFSYKDQIATIYNACPITAKKCLFSATISDELESWAAVHLEDHVTVFIGSKNSTPKTIKQELIFVGQDSGKLLGLRQIIHTSMDPPLLLFVNSIDKAREVYDELIYDGINVDILHSDKTEAQRKSIVNSFRTGKIWVLITTDLMSRGIDFKGIKKVVNYDVPHSPITYIHRIGRTGRAGMPGSAITFYTENDFKHLKNILPILKESNAVYPEYLNQL